MSVGGPGSARNGHGGNGAGGSARAFPSAVQSQGAYRAAAVEIFEAIRTQAAWVRARAAELGAPARALDAPMSDALERQMRTACDGIGRLADAYRALVGDLPGESFGERLVFEAEAERRH